MAMVVMEQQQQQQQQRETYKYYCRICNKGFGCGPALGGHMRAHGDTDNDPSDCSDWGDNDKFDLPPSSSGKCTYALRANPNHFRSCRTCENCGKEFASWKSFLDHGKCNSDDDDVDDQEDYELLASSPRSDDADDDGRIGQRSCAGRWSKRKRSQRPKSAAVPTTTTEEEDLANCLVMLSSANVNPVIISEPEKSSPSESKEEDREYRAISVAAQKYKEPAQAFAAAPKGMFECKACKKVFSSHQALGGHRASHKKVKGCFAAKLDDPADVEAPLPEVDTANQENINVAETTMAIVPFHNIPLAAVPVKQKSKVHECSICHRQFSSGQALGGHKRCHWITSSSPDPASIPKARQVQNTRSPDLHQHHQHHELITLRPMSNSSEPIDLNMPAAPVDGLGALRQDIGSPLRLELLSAAVSLEPWVEEHKNKAACTSTNNINNNKNSYNEGDCSMEVDDDDEIDSRIKLAKLSELKDVNAGGEASPWLQVGIGSSGNEGSEK